MADAAILNCQNRKMLLAIMVHRAKTHHSAEFSKKKISPSVVQILRFFDYSRWRPQPSWTFKIVKFYWLTGFTGLRRIMWCHMSLKSVNQLWRYSIFLFSLLGKLARRAIYFTNVFSLFFIFVMVDFLAPVAQTLMEQSSPKFQDWQTGVRACSPHWAFLIFEGTLPWQRVKVEKLAFFPDQSTLSLCHSVTEWDNALYMQI